MRQVDTSNGGLRVGTHIGPLQTEHVYSGGNNCYKFTFFSFFNLLKAFLAVSNLINLSCWLQAPVMFLLN